MFTSGHRHVVFTSGHSRYRTGLQIHPTVHQFDIGCSVSTLTSDVAVDVSGELGILNMFVYLVV